MTIEQFIVKVNAIAKIGLKFSQDAYALENYEELRLLSNDMLNKLVDQPIEQTLFERDIYPTVNVSVRTIVLNDQDEVLMVKEKSEQLWSFPGGWCDLYESPKENAVKECLQESGYEVEIQRLCAIFFRDDYKHKKPTLISEYVIYFVAQLGKQITQHNHEISEIGFFKLDNLPPLSFKNSKEEVDRAIACVLNGTSDFD